MKLHILSDLHIDSYKKRGLLLGNLPQTDADIILLAGDISNSDLGMHWAIKQAERLKKPILYLAGNHEYFEEDIHTFDQTLRTLTRNTSVTFLQKNSVDLQGIRFLGCTLWTGFNYISENQSSNNANHEKNHTSDMLKIASSCMRDYNNIYAKDSSTGFVTPEMVLNIHQDHKSWLKNELLKAYDEQIPCVVMVHHGVSPQSISPQYANHSNNAMFINDLSTWMQQDWAPKLWVHGHVHDAFDYQCGNTRVVVNPRAYPKETSSTIAFDWAKVVEITA